VEKLVMGGGPVALHSFWSLKKSTSTFNIRLNEPSLDILGLLGLCDHPRGKNKNIQTIKKNKNASMIVLLAKTN